MLKQLATFLLILLAAVAFFWWLGMAPSVTALSYLP